MREGVGKSLRLEEWARGDSILHRRDARAKIGATLLFLVAVSTMRPGDVREYVPAAAVLGAGVLAGRLPVGELLARGMVILPFPLVFALVSWLETGDGAWAAGLLARSYLSAVAVLLLMGVTPLADLLRGLRGLGVPALLVMVLQGLVRYLQVIADQGARMRRAAACRDGGRVARGGRESLWRRASGAMAVLFGRSYERAEGVHRAMVARGFRGEFISPRPAAFSTGDWAYLGVTAAVVAGMRWLGGWR